MDASDQTLIYFGYFWAGTRGLLFILLPCWFFSYDFHYERNKITQVILWAILYVPVVGILATFYFKYTKTRVFLEHMCFFVSEVFLFSSFVVICSEIDHHTSQNQSMSVILLLLFLLIYGASVVFLWKNIQQIEKLPSRWLRKVAPDVKEDHIRDCVKDLRSAVEERVIMAKYEAEILEEAGKRIEALREGERVTLEKLRDLHREFRRDFPDA